MNEEKKEEKRSCYQIPVKFFPSSTKNEIF